MFANGSHLSDFQCLPMAAIFLISNVCRWQPSFWFPMFADGSHLSDFQCLPMAAIFLISNVCRWQPSFQCLPMAAIFLISNVYTRKQVLRSRSRMRTQRSVGTWLLVLVSRELGSKGNMLTLFPLTTLWCVEEAITSISSCSLVFSFWLTDPLYAKKKISIVPQTTYCSISPPPPPSPTKKKIKRDVHKLSSFCASTALYTIRGFRTRTVYLQHVI